MNSLGLSILDIRYSVMIPPPESGTCFTTRRSCACEVKTPIVSLCLRNNHTLIEKGLYTPYEDFYQGLDDRTGLEYSRSMET